MTENTYSVLVRRIVNIRVDGVRATSQTDAIARVQAEGYGNFLFSRFGEKDTPALEFGDGVTVRYTEVSEDPDNAGFLVDEEGDPDFEKSTWYAADGVTVNNMPANATTCDLCAGEIVNAEKARDRKAALALAKQAIATGNPLRAAAALQEMVKAFGPGGE